MILTHVTGTVTTTVTLPGALLPFDQSTNRDQTMGVTANGSVKVYDNAVNEYFVSAKFRLTSAQRTSLRDFIRTTVKFAYATFNLTPDAGVDIGGGDATAVAVRYWDKTWQESQVSPSLYEVQTIFRREAT